MNRELRRLRRPDGRSKSLTWAARGMSAVAGAVIAGVLAASPAAAQSSTPGEALTGAVKSGGAAAPAPPNTTNPEATAKELGGSGPRENQNIVRAVVTSDGTLVPGQSFRAVSANRVESPVGTYQVCFDARITNGTYVASIGIPGNAGVSAPGEVTVVGRYGTDNCLYIQTFDSSGTLADRDFHVTVAYSK